MSRATLITEATAGGQPNGVPLLDGGSGLLVPTYSEISHYTVGQLPASPAAAKSRLYADSNGQFQALNPAGQVRRLATHWGSAAAFPTSTALAAGDTCVRSDIGTNGTIYQYTGLAGTGVSGWITEAPILCTSGTRPSVGLYVGVQIYETDTHLSWLYDGALWAPVGAGQWTTPIQSATSYSTVLPAGNADLVGYGIAVGALLQPVVPNGRQLEVQFRMPQVQLALAGGNSNFSLLLGGTLVDGQFASTIVPPAGGSGYASIPAFLSGYKAGTGAAMQIQVQAYGTNATASAGAGIGPYLRYRIV